MANVKITELTALTDPASTDVLPIVDVVADITKKISIADLLENAGSGTAAAPGIAFDGDSNTGIYRPGADQLALATNGTERVEFGTSEVVFNDGGANYDFRIEGNAKANLLFVDASADQVGVGTNANGSNARFEIKSTTGSINSATLRLNSSDTTTGAVDTGSTLLLSGHDGSVSGRDFASVFAAKENSTSGNYASYLAFGTRANGGAVGERLRITSDGKVGVGTSSPDQLLHLSNSSGPVIRIENTDTTLTTNNLIGGVEFETQDATSPGVGVTGGIRMYAADTFGGQSYMTFSTTNGSSKDNEVMRISNVGSVGIGTQSPSSVLHIKANTDATTLPSIILEDSGTASTRLSSISNRTGDLRLAATASLTDLRSYIYLQDDRQIIFGQSNSEAARIDTSGRLLVGTSDGYGIASSGLAKFQVGAATTELHASLTDWSTFNQGGILAFGAARGGAVGDYTIVQNGDNLGALRFAGADGTDLQTQAASIAAQVDGTPGANDMPGRLVFSTNPGSPATSPTERMRIAANGYVHFGPSAPSPGNAETVRIQTKDATNRALVLRTSNPSSTSYSMVQFLDGDTNSCGEIIINASANTTNYSTSSDYRLKENIASISSPVERLNQLNPCSFNFISSPDTRFDGFLAHEAQAVVPEAVNGTKDEVDEDGNPVLQGIDQSKLVPLLTAALQEALAEIESLKARVTALEP